MNKVFVMGIRIALQDVMSTVLMFMRRELLNLTKITGLFQAQANRLSMSMRQLLPILFRTGQGFAQIGSSISKGLGGLVNGINFGSIFQQAGTGVQNLVQKLGNMSSNGTKSGGIMKSLAVGAKETYAQIIQLASGIGKMATGESAKKGFEWLIQGNADLEQYRNTLNAVLGSQDKGGETLEWAKQYSARTPFEIGDIVEATTKLTGFGLEAQKVLSITGDMAATMGTSIQDASEAIGEAQTGEVDRLKEFGITKDMIVEKARQLGASVVDAQGEITDQLAFNASLFGILEDKYLGGAERQSKTFNGMLSVIRNYVTSVGNELGKPIFEKLKTGLTLVVASMQKFKDSGQLTAWIQKIHAAMAVAWGVLEPVIQWLITVGLPAVMDALIKVGDWVVKVAGWIKDHWSIIKPLVEGLVIAWGAFVIAMTAVTVATWLWNAALAVNPVALLITGIGLLIGAIIWLIQNWDAVKAKTKEVWDSIVSTIMQGVEGVKGWLSKIPLVSKFFGKSESEETRKIHEEIVGSAALQDSAEMYQYHQANQVAMQDQNQFSSPHIDGSHATGLYRVPFDGYTATLHGGERVLTASEARQYDSALGFQQPASSARSTEVRVDKLVEKVEIYAAPGDDGEALYEKFITVFYRKAKEASGLLSSGEMGVLL